MKTDAMALLGEHLESVTFSKGGGDGSNQHKKATGSKKEPVAPTLDSLGIDKKLSADAQLLADVAESDPETFAEVKAGKEVGGSFWGLPIFGPETFAEVKAGKEDRQGWSGLHEG